MRALLVLPLLLATAACPGPPRLLASAAGDAGPAPADCASDQDGDGFGPGCESGPDCDDEDADVHSLLTFFPDDDGDGALSDKAVERCTDGALPRGGSFDIVTANIDCDDDTPARAPGLPEECDGVDNNCSGAADEGNTCPCEAIADGDRTYLRCEATTWDDACQLPGYTLVVVDDAAEQAFLDQLGGSFWIGLSDQAQEGEFVWANGAAIDFDGFGGGQPDDFRGGEDCVESSGLNWNDAPCGQLRDALCEADPALLQGDCIDGDGDLRGAGCPRGPDCDDGDSSIWAVRGGWADEDGDGATTALSFALCIGDEFPPGFAPAPSGVDCDDRDAAIQVSCDGCDVRYFGGQSYLFCDENRNWTEARDRCRNRDRELATINNAEENAFLSIEGALLNINAWWIGLNDRQNEDEFEWIADGSPLSFDAFAAGEPNNSNGEDCVELTGSQWNDSECFSDRRYICESL